MWIDSSVLIMFIAFMAVITGYAAIIILALIGKGREHQHLESIERQQRAQHEHNEKVAQLQAAASNRLIVLRVAQIERVEPETARQDR